MNIFRVRNVLLKYVKILCTFFSSNWKKFHPNCTKLSENMQNTSKTLKFTRNAIKREIQLIEDIFSKYFFFELECVNDSNKFLSEFHTLF